MTQRTFAFMMHFGFILQVISGGVVSHATQLPQTSAVGAWSVYQVFGEPGGVLLVDQAILKVTPNQNRSAYSQPNS